MKTVEVFFEMFLTWFKLLGLTVYKRKALRGYLYISETFLGRKFITSANSLGIPQPAQLEKELVEEIERPNYNLDSPVSVPEQLLLRNKGLTKVLNEINNLSGGEEIHRFKFYYLAERLLNHPEKHLLTGSVLCNLLVKSIQFQNFPLSSHIVEWGISREIQFRLSVVFNVVNELRSTDPYLAYKLFCYSFRRPDNNMTMIELDEWILHYIQYLGWEAQFAFYETVYEKHHLEIFSPEAYLVFLKTISNRFSNIKIRSQFPQDADIIIQHAQIKYGDRSDIVNQILRLKAPIESSAWTLNFLESMESNSIYPEYQSISLLCYVFAYRSEFSIIDELLKTSSSPLRDEGFDTFDATLKGLLDSGKLEDAKRLFHKNLDSNRVSLTSFSNMIEVLTDNGEVDQALELLLRMDQLCLSLTPFIGHCILSGFVQMKEFLSAFEFYEEMIRLDIKPDLQTLELLLKGAYESEAWPIVFKTYYCSLRKGCFEFTPCIIQSLAAAQTETKDLDGLHHTLRELTFFLAGPKAQLFPEADYFSLMNFLCNQKKSNELTLVFNHLLKFYLIKSNEPFNIMLKHYQTYRDATKSEYIYNMMCSNGLQPDPVTYQIMLNLYSSRGALNEAIKWKRKLYENGCDIPLSNIVILTKLHLNSGQPKQAIELYNQHATKNTHISSELLELAIKAHIQVKDQNCLSNSIELVRNSKVTPNVSTFEIIIQEALACQNFDAASSVFEIYKEKKLPEDIKFYNFLISYYLNSGLADKATNVYKELIRKEIDPDLTTFSHFIVHYTSIDDLHKTKHWTNIMLQLAIMPTTHLCNKILDQYIRDTSYDSTFEFFDTMVWCQVPCNRLTIELMTKFFILYGRYEELVSFLESLDPNPELRPDARLLDSIVDSLNSHTPTFFLPQLTQTAKRLNWTISQNIRNKTAQ